jgi:hypothetical protein
MIYCTPRGLCSWDYDLAASGHSASAEFNWVDEQGSMTIGGEYHGVRKHGVFSGHWTLEAHSAAIATAQKANAFTRSFHLATTSGSVALSAQSALERTMLLHGAGFDGVIAPVHPFTRRATITGQIPDFRTACFAFWLTVLLWRRAAHSSS